MQHDRMQYRRRVGEPRGLHDHAPKRHPAVVEPAQQPFERVDQIAPHRAAHAAAREHRQSALDLLDQQMVQSDLAEFVDEHRRIGERRVLEQPIEQARLAGTEKAGQHGQRQRRAGATGRRGAGALGRPRGSAHGFGPGDAAGTANALGESVGAGLNKWPEAGAVLAALIGGGGTDVGAAEV